MALGDNLPDLFLTGVVIADREGHELFQLHAILLVDLEQLVRNGHQAQALLDHGGHDEERGSDFFLGHAFFQHVAKGAKLVQWMQRYALDVFGQGIILGENGRSGLAHDAGHRGGLRQFLLLHQQFEGAEPAAPGRHFVAAGFCPLAVQDRPDVQTLKQAPTFDVAGQFLDRQAGLHAPYVGLRQYQPVERDITGRIEGDFLDGARHGGTLRDGQAEASLPPLNPSRKPHVPLPLSRPHQTPDRLHGTA
ncbi:hypothetical protein [Acetobacter aceti]